MPLFSTTKIRCETRGSRPRLEAIMAGIPCDLHGLDMVMQPALQSAKVDRVLLLILVIWGLRCRPWFLVLCHVCLPWRTRLATRIPSFALSSADIHGTPVVDIP